MTRLPASVSALFAFLLIGTFAFTGCESPASSSEADIPVTTANDQSSKYVEMPAIPTDMKEESGNATEMIQNFSSSFGEIEALLQSLHQTPSLGEKDRLIRDALASHQSESDVFLRSIAAERGLIAILESDTKRKYTSSIELYTAELLANDSPNAHLIHDALTQLQGTWSKARIRDAAQATTDRSIQWLNNTQEFTQEKTAAAQSDERLAMSVSGHQNLRNDVRDGVSQLSELMN